MQTHPNVDLADDAAESLPPPSSRRTKLAVAGVAMASAGALALTPVIATPTLPDVQVDRLELARTDAYAMTAAWNPLQAWQAVFDDSSVQLETLFAAADTAFGKLSDSLSDPDVQHRLTSFLRTNFQDPMTIPNALLGFQDNYGDRISAALSASGDSSAAFFSGLFNERQERNPGGSRLFVAPDGTIVRYTSGGAWQLEQPGPNVPYTGDTDALQPKMVDGLIPSMLRTLTQGKIVEVDAVTGQIVPDGNPDGVETVQRDVRFLDAFGDANLFFLMDALGDQRADALDIVRIPGDFLESIGAETLGRILGTSWMDADPNRPGWTNAGLLSRSRLGNLARALIAPQVTTIFQTVEILDDLNNALQDNDYELALRTVVDAPAKITNAFLNGYVSPTLHGDNEADRFPGLFSSGSTLNFIFNEVPGDIANVLGLVKPGSAAARNAISSTETGTNLVSVQTEVPEVEEGNDDAVAPEAPATEAPSKDTPVTETVTEGEVDETGTITDGTADGASDARELTSKDRISLLREQAAEKRAERVEQRKERISNARDAVERVGSNIRKGLGLPDRSQKNDSTSKAGNDGGNDDSGKSESGSKSKSDSKSASSDD